jgi:hypothetical protein
MPRWTPQARLRQSELIKRVKPWRKSTGPVTPHGKSQSARNGCHHAPRPPGTHPRELRRSRRRLWKLWKLQLDMAPLGIFDPDWAMALAAQIQAVEAGLGIDPTETQHRLTGSLAKTGHSERSSERVPESVA